MEVAYGGGLMFSAMIAVGVILGGLLLLGLVRDRQSQQMREYAKHDEE